MKQVDIEHLVRWAYRDELPKEAATPYRLSGPRMVAGSEVLARLGELHTLVQEQSVVNRYGVLPLLDGGPNDPHPDALAVAAAVEELAGFEVILPEGWNPLADLGDLGAEGQDAVRRGLDRLAPLNGAGVRVARASLARLVIRRAILGDAPPWQADAPTRRMVTANGKPRWFRKLAVVTDGAFGPVTEMIEVDGYNASRQRPFPGAYRKFELDPDPVPVVVERGEHELWVAGLTALVQLLEGKLSDHVPLPPARPARPWEGAEPSARILPSCLAPATLLRAGERKGEIAA